MEAVTSNQSSPEIVINDNFAALSHVAIWAMKVGTTVGLQWGYYGGTWNGVTVPDGTIVLDPNTTNYIVLELATGTVSSDTSITDWNNLQEFKRLYIAATGPASIGSFVDHRASVGGSSGQYTGGPLQSCVQGPEASTAAYTTSTLPVVEATGYFVDVSTTSPTIASLGTAPLGTLKRLRFDGVYTIVHSAALTCLGADDVVTYDGDISEFIATAAGWEMISYTRGNGASLGITPINAATVSTTIQVELGHSDMFLYTMAGDRTLANPTAPVDGKRFKIRIKQDATGSRIMTYGSQYKFSGPSALSTAANSVDILDCVYVADDAAVYCTLAKAFA